MSESYLIWSNEHRAWWRSNSSGYALETRLAGRYPRNVALSICAKARDGWDRKSAPPEIPVREADVLEIEDVT